jgi:hypothetical protein
LGVIDDETPGQEKIAGEEQSGLAIVIRNVGRIMPRRRNHVDDAIPKIQLSQTVRPIGEAEVLPDVSEVSWEQ